MIPPFARKNLLIAMDGAPSIVATITKSVPSDSNVWDVRLDPERFTAREALAHLADWESVFTARIGRCLTEDSPRFSPISLEDRIVLERYGEREPAERLRLFRERRDQLLKIVTGLTDEDLARSGVMGQGDTSVEIPVSVQEWIVAIVAHDSYHILQLAELLS